MSQQSTRGSKSSSPNKRAPSSQAKSSSSKSRAGKSAARPQDRKPTPQKKSARSSANNGRTLPGVSGIKIKSRPVEREVSPQKVTIPRWWKRLKKELPPYADEMFGFLMIGVGLLSFLTLLSPESGEVGTAWSGVLRQLFGLGAFAIAGLIVAAGAALLMPKLGIPVRINWMRISLGEVVFVLTLATIHARIRANTGGEAGQVEAFAQAMAGRGGGLVGWAIQELLHMLLGDVVTGIILLSLLAITVGLMVGVERKHVLDNLERLQAWLLKVAESLEPPPPPPAPLPDLSGLPVDVSDAADAASRQLGEGETAVELPPLPGRPSIVTGERGSGVVLIQRPEAQPLGATPFKKGGRPATRIERLKAKHADVSKNIEMRFKLEEVQDKRRTRKRSDKLPPLELMDDRKFDRPSDEEINMSAAIIEETASDLGVPVKVVSVKAGPTVTQYAVTPFTEVVDADGNKTVNRVRVTRVARLATDMALALAAPSVRIQAPVPGTNYIGIEVPNMQPGIVSLRPVMESEQFYKIKHPLAIALGREVDGQPMSINLSKMPHMLIGGTTGSGKSVCLRSIATCLVSNNHPDNLRLIMLDPKMVELVRFNGLPHLLGHVEVQLDRIIGVLRWITREMDRRYRLMEEAMARNIDVYNQRQHYSKRLPRIVVLIDELAELMMEYPDETEHLITRLAQMARATGIHLVVATQRPSTDVVTGLIKANFPARIAFAVASSVDSRVIIDSVGAEDLIGKGDLLYQSPEAAAPVRLQGCFVSDIEMEHVVDFWRDNWVEDDDDDGIAPWERSLRRTAILKETDDMLMQAIRLVQAEREASASQLQRKLNIGYPRAGRIVDRLHELGVVGPEQTGGRTREVLIQPDDDPLDYILERRMKQ